MYGHTHHDLVRMLHACSQRPTMTYCGVHALLQTNVNGDLMGLDSTTGDHIQWTLGGHTHHELVRMLHACSQRPTMTYCGVHALLQTNVNGDLMGLDSTTGDHIQWTLGQAKTLGCWKEIRFPPGWLSSAKRSSAGCKQGRHDV
jgi:hypothetical protein